MQHHDVAYAEVGIAVVEALRDSECNFRHAVVFRGGRERAYREVVQDGPSLLLFG